MTKLWETPNPRERRVPIRIKRHSRFLFGRTLTVVGTRWSRTWGLLPKGERLSTVNTPQWLGGMSWDVKRGAKGRTLTRPTIALCKWRYR